MALYCPSCGKSLGDDAAFCSACGKAVPNASAPGVYRPRLMRARNGRKIAGVCQGLANYLGWDVTLLRVVAVLLAVITFPVGIIIYLVFWLMVPEEPLALPIAKPVDSAI